VSLLSRISGLVVSLDSVHLDQRDRVGASGEHEVELIIRQSQWRYLRNPLVPHATRPGVYIEGDFLVLANDTLCVVEVKNLVGRLFFEDAEQRVVRQEKLGRYGDVMSSKQLPNPLPKVNSFARRLKDHLAGLDARFRRVYVDAVVVFAPTADISGIYDPAGLISIGELPGYIQRQTRDRGSGQRPWLADAYGSRTPGARLRPHRQLHGRYRKRSRLCPLGRRPNLSPLLLSRMTAWPMLPPRFMPQAGPLRSLSARRRSRMLPC